MKGYNKGLNNFIEYIFKKYCRDTQVKQFKEIYNARKVELEERKKLSKRETPKIKISPETAKLCHNLIVVELAKNQITNCFEKEYLQKLEIAHAEFIESEYNKAHSKFVLERLKNENE